MSRVREAILELSGGNIRNGHIYLREVIGMFPEESIGGSNRGQTGVELEVSFGKEKTTTDIDGEKLVFRCRGAVDRFFKTDNLNEGDLVLIERHSDREYSVRKVEKRIFRHYL